LPKVLFVGHNLSRSGAPIVLLTLMRWLKARGGWEMAALFPEPGELLEDYAAVAPSQVLEPAAKGAAPRKVKIPFEPDLVYFNSIASAAPMRYVPPKGCRTLCHLHELEYVIRTFLGAGPTAPFFGRFDRFIACAGVVRQNLVEKHGIAASRIDLVHEFVAAGAIQSRVKRASAGKWLRQQLRLPAGSLVVGTAGALEWRKGSDLYLQLARAVRRLAPALPVHFVSVGRADRRDGPRLKHDLARMPELKGRVHFVPPQRDAIPFIAGADVFVLPSREDPFPVVCIEAAAVGTPIVCFEGGGGAVELVEADCGAIVPYADVAAMADAVLRLLQDPAARARMGAAGSEKARRLYDIAVAGPKVVQAMEAALR
jgi:glycosyltransferase involved in cell wall biosynthesis